MRTKQPETPPEAEPTEIRGWLTGRLPSWFDEAPDVVVDREEITIIGTLPAPAVADQAAEAERSAARRGKAQAFREETREQRIGVAQELEARYRRAVAWGVRVDGEQFLFTHHAVPVMTRLRQPERQVLDTLVAGGVARSRADALAWCVRLVGQHADDWLAELKDALAAVERVRSAGPQT
jgi:hypothetical protein